MKLELTENWHEPSPEILYSLKDEDVLKATLLLVATTVEALKELQEFQNKSKLSFH